MVTAFVVSDVDAVDRVDEIAYGAGDQAWPGTSAVGLNGFCERQFIPLLCCCTNHDKRVLVKEYFGSGEPFILFANL